LWYNLLGISATTTELGSSNPSTDLFSDNQLDDYSYLTEDNFILDNSGVLLRCASGLGPTSSNNNSILGGFYFRGMQIIIRSANSCMTNSVFEVCSNASGRYPGVINLYPCGPLSPDEEGVYSCMMMDSSMMVQTTRVGLYLSGRSE